MPTIEQVADTIPGAAEEPRIPAAAILIGRTGASELKVYHCTEQKPPVWIAAARWHKRWEACAGMTPARALFRLCDETLDGGQCQHCGRPAGFSEDLDPMPLTALVCWYAWEPGTRTFTRGCD